MFRKLLRRIRNYFGSRTSSHQPIHQIFLFNKRPVLHGSFNQKSLQEAINELQQRLLVKGYSLNASGRFDVETENAVRAFQRDYSLLVDGVVEPLTWTCLFYPATLVYGCHKGASSETKSAVEELQQILKDEGLVIQDNEGCFEKDTKKAVKSFQRKYGLKVDGCVGAVTWAVLLGMRQEVPQAFFRIPLQSLQMLDQFLRLCFLLLGMYFNPFATAAPPPVPHAVVTAYMLTFVVPIVLTHFPVRIQSELYLLKYAPYVGTGMFWQSVFRGMGTFIDRLMEKLL